MTTEEILESYKKLKTDWYGDGGIPIGLGAIVKAQEIIAAGILPFDTAPLPNGGIDLEWDWDWPDGILVEISPDGANVSICIYKRGNNGYEYTSYGVDTIQRLREIVCQQGWAR